MSGFAHSFVARFLAILSGLAMNVCVCARMTGGLVEREQTGSQQNDAHACCRAKSPSKSESPAPNDEPCKTCDARQQAGAAVTEPSAKPTPPSPLVAVMDVDSDDASLTASLHQLVIRLEHIANPLLADLFHSHCQLLC